MRQAAAGALWRGLPGLSLAALASSAQALRASSETECSENPASTGPNVAAAAASASAAAAAASAVGKATLDADHGVANPVTTPQRVAIVGATGAVGLELLEVLQRRGFPLQDLRLFASKRSAGKRVATPLGMVPVEEFSVARAREADVVFLAVSGGFAEK